MTMFARFSAAVEAVGLGGKISTKVRALSDDEGSTTGWRLALNRNGFEAAIKLDGAEPSSEEISVAAEQLGTDVVAAEARARRRKPGSVAGPIAAGTVL